MPPPRTGYVEPRRRANGSTYFLARVRLADGTRERVKVPASYSTPAGGRSARERAELYAEARQEREDQTGELLAAKRARLAEAAAAKAQPSGTAETVAKWCDRWLADRKERGIHTVEHDRGRLGKHVLPILGRLDVRTFARADVERVVEALDEKIRLDEDDEHHLSWKTASNVWVLVSKMGKDLVNAKRRDLRVREDNPAERVHAPERGSRPAKQYLYPSEFERLVGCKGIELAFRTLYAVAVYTYARSNELAALGWDDVDLTHNVIHITKSVDRATHKVKSTKTGTTRRIPIEPALRPVLSRLHQERDGKPAVVWMPDHEDRAILLRKHLDLAGVKRAELFTSDAQRKHITFHDLRATGITWAAVRGDDPLRIKQRAGHLGFATTEIYIREAENLREGFGAVFPALTPLLPEGPLAHGLAQIVHLHADFPALMVEQRGIEPRTSALRTQRSPS
jgi:integrase